MSEKLMPHASSFMPEDVLDVLTSLVDKSLVIAETLGRETRYGLLESVRQYAQERLEEAGAFEEWRGRHRDFFLALAEEAEPHLRASEQAVWLGRLETEHDNLRAALAWCREAEGQAEAGLRLTGALWRFWEVRGYNSEGRTHLTTALSQKGTGGRTSERAKALNGAGGLASNQGDYTSARAFFEESLAIGRELGDKVRIATALGNLGVVATNQGDYATARPPLEEGLAIRRELGDQWGIANALGNLGTVAEYLGDYSTARSLQEESLAICWELGDRWGIANALNNLGRVAEYQGDYASARSLQKESLAIWQELGSKHGSAWSLEALASLDFGQAQMERAARLWGAAEAFREEVGTPLELCFPEYEGKVASAREVLGEEAFALAWAAGRAMTLEEAIAYALEESGEPAG